MDTPEPGTIDELCWRFAGTIGIGEDYIRRQEKRGILKQQIPEFLNF
jgi:hypothetical protein